MASQDSDLDEHVGVWSRSRRAQPRRNAVGGSTNTTADQVLEPETLERRDVHTNADTNNNTDTDQVGGAGVENTSFG